MKKDYVKPVATKIEIKLDENIAESTGVSQSGGFSFEQIPIDDCYKYMTGYDITGTFGFTGGLSSSEVMGLLYAAEDAGIISSRMTREISQNC